MVSEANHDRITLMCVVYAHREPLLAEESGNYLFKLVITA